MQFVLPDSKYLYYLKPQNINIQNTKISVIVFQLVSKMNMFNRLWKAFTRFDVNRTKMRSLESVCLTYT